MKRKQHPNKKRKKKKFPDEDFEIGNDDNFAFIAGYTSGGAPYGLTYEDWNEILEREGSEDFDRQRNST
jgi:hypothetical protein